MKRDWCKLCNDFYPTGAYASNLFYKLSNRGWHRVTQEAFIKKPVTKDRFFINWLPKLELIRNEHYQEIMEMSHLLAGMQRYFPMLKANAAILH